MALFDWDRSDWVKIHRKTTLTWQPGQHIYMFKYTSIVGVSREYFTAVVDARKEGRWQLDFNQVDRQIREEQDEQARRDRD